MMTSFGTLKEGEAVRLRCLSRTLTAEIREVRTSTGGETIMVSVVTRDNVPRRELPPGQGVAIYGLDASLWEGVIGGSTDSAATILLQTTSGSGTSSDKGESSSSRKDLLHRANLAQQFRKYDEMNLAVKDISLLHLDLTSEELECAVCCYNDLLKENWSVLKVLRSRGAENLAHVPARVVRDFSARIEDKLLKQCEDALGNIETHLLPFSSQENKAVFYKMMGDIALLALEVKSDDGHAMVNTATKSYEMAMSTMLRENISPNDTSFLELILNLSALLHDVVLSKTRACTLAIEAVAAVSTETLSLKSKIVLDLINQNLNIWLSNESAEHTQVKDEHGTEIDPLPEVLPDAKPQGLQPLFPEVVGAAVVPHGAHQHHQAQGDLINELQHVAGQAVIPFQALDLPPDEDTISANENEDRISALPDDVLLQILEGLHTHTVIQTGVLSTRWRHLPHQLSSLQINVKDFRGSEDQIMTAYTDAIRRFLSPPPCGCFRIIKILQLSFYLADPYLSSIARAVGDAVKIGVTEFLEFAASGYVLSPSEAEEVLSRQRFMSFFHACPAPFNLLNKLTLQRLSFEDSDVPNILNTCKKLEILSLRYCQMGQDPVLTIDAPCSELTGLELIDFGCEQVELICAPKLLELVYDTWCGENPPVSFGYVPQLVKVCFASPALSWQTPFTLSECLSSNKNLSILHLNFRTQMIWLEPEDPRQLTPIFSKLRDVHLYNIFAECDLNWTMFILEGAPALENFYLSLRSCELSKTEDSAEKTNVMWEPSKDSRHLNLKFLMMKGFKEEDKVMNYIRLVMVRAVVLKRIELHNEDPCKGCSAINHDPPRFLDEASKQRIRERLTHGSSSSAEIIVG